MSAEEKQGKSAPKGGSAGRTRRTGHGTRTKAANAAQSKEKKNQAPAAAGGEAAAPKPGKNGGTKRRRTPSAAGGKVQKALAAARQAPMGKAKSVEEYFARQEASEFLPAAPAKPERSGRRMGGRGRRGKDIVKIISLGGLGEIGKNLYVYECREDLLIVDCGLAFPDTEMLGVDMVIPDFTYLERNREKIRGVVITHGHEDHIGGLPYLLKQLNVPVYGTDLTIGLIEGKLKEHGLLGRARLFVVKPGDVLPFGCMSVELINVNHSIPGAVGLAVETPVGVIVHTGDFKVDFTPVGGEQIDLARFGALGEKGVLALLSDSTNAERPGIAMTERTVGASFASLFRNADGRRIIIASFSSNVYRIQQIVDIAVQTGRRVCFVGRSMLTFVTKAIELGYLRVPDGVIVPVENVNRHPRHKMIIVCTGSQGEPLSALSRMSMGEHRQVNITSEDFIIISATPIPGNEKFVSRLVNDLMRLGAEVIYERMYEVHVSGHACQEELKMMLGLTKPKFFIPMHGEYKHMQKHAGLARRMGIPEDHIFIGELGRVIETDGVTMKFGGTVPAGGVMVDGIGVGDVGSVVLRDRKHLGEDGLIVIAASVSKKTGKLVGTPEIVSRGFVYMKESEELIAGVRRVLKKAFQPPDENANSKDYDLKGRIRDLVGDYLFQKTKRKPMILPIVMEV